ncbi:MAG: hypothetical protein ABI699_06505 [Caldimonas sp.]
MKKADPKKDGEAIAALLKKMQDKQTELAALDEKYKRGRRNQDLANNLAAKANADYARTVENAMKFFASAVEKTATMITAVKGRKRSNSV